MSGKRPDSLHAKTSSPYIKTERTNHAHNKGKDRAPDKVRSSQPKVTVSGKTPP